jgi:hypothetical protein
MIADVSITGIKQPLTVELEINGKALELKTASSRTKPAILTTGLVVQVPD